MSSIKQQVRLVQKRQQRQWMIRCISVATFASSSLAFAASLIRWPMANVIGWQWIIALLFIGPIAGVLFAWLRAYSLRDAAVTIDRTFQLKDRTQTALNFLSASDRTMLQKMQIEDTESHVSQIDLNKIAACHRPRFVPWTVALSIAALVVMTFSNGVPQAIASATTNETVIAVAEDAEEQLKELEAFEQEIADEDIAELVKELKKQVEALKDPGVDPKEALAKLSEMEASLKEMQLQLQEAGQQADLEKIGEALSLSEEMATAGQAMAKGELDKAAQELAKLQMPNLDLKTEKAITEKLKQLNNNDGAGSPKKSTQLKEATENICEGLGNGNKSKFSEGMNGLAGECKKQGQKKKLADLLKKQCQCLSECKSECENECRDLADSKKKGGKNAGTGRSGNEAGEKTVRLKTSPELKIKGQDSDKGDIDVETEQSDMQQQQASREYREKVDKYKALSESVLESESIPLGHRQTIRKYFESIRPQQEEIEQVDMQSQSTEP